MMTFTDVVRRYRGKVALFVREMLLIDGQEIDPEQLKVLNDFERCKRLYIKAGHGVGKTALEAWIAIYFMCVYPKALVAVTAPTVHQLHDVFAVELKRWYDQSRLKELDLFDFKASEITINSDEYKTEWRIVLKASSVPENLQGLHSPYMLYIIDEASGVAQKVLEVVEGALTTENVYFLACGNPTKNSGMFFDAFGKYKDDNNLYTINCENIHRPGMQEYCAKMAKKYGKKSNTYAIRVLGEFAKAAKDATFPAYIVENSLNTKGVLDRCIVLGIDPGAGGDLSVVFERCGKQIIGIHEFDFADTTKLYPKFEKICRQNPGFSIHINIDSTGLGKPIFDMINLMIEEKRIHATVYPVNFKNTPKNPVEYADRPSELYFNAKNKLATGEYGIIDNESGDLFAQLTERPFDYVDGSKLKILDKKSFVKAFGLSPNHSDAFVLCMEDPETVSCCGAAA